MAEHHEHGSMNIETHERTFEGFITFVTRAVVVIIVVLILLALINA